MSLAIKSPGFWCLPEQQRGIVLPVEVAYASCWQGLVEGLHQKRFRALQYYTGRFEILVGLLSLGLASAMFSLYTRKRRVSVGPAATGNAAAGLATGALVMFQRRKGSK